METVQTPKAKTLNNKYTNKRRKQSKTTQCYISDTLSYIQHENLAQHATSH